MPMHEETHDARFDPPEEPQPGASRSRRARLILTLLLLSTPVVADFLGSSRSPGWLTILAGMGFALSILQYVLTEPGQSGDEGPYSKPSTITR
jgi:hypothetical protein